MNHNRLVVKDTEAVWDDELKTLVPVTSTEVFWRGEGIPTDPEWNQLIEELKRSGHSIEDLSRQERRTFRIGGVALPLGWRDTVPSASPETVVPVPAPEAA